MLTLLVPSALLGLSLLAIPIIVHLFKPRKVRQTPFSSLRWLHLTQQRLARRIRWHQILLFLLRAAFIVLLVAALARPIFHPAGEAGMSERFIVLDVSRSMGYQSGERPSPLETGKQLAASLLSGGESDDRTALLACGTTTKVVAPLARGAERHLPALTALEAGPTDTDLGSALDVIRPLLRQRRSGARVELYVITDNQQGSWRQNAIEALLDESGDHLRATIIDVADPAPRNGWIADCRLAEEPSSGRRSLEVQLRATGGEQERTVRLAGVAGLDARSQTIQLEPGRATHVTFPLPPDLDTRGQSAEVVLEPADALPSDDRWFVLLDDEASLRALLVEGGEGESGSFSPGFLLRTAMDSLSSPAQKIHVTSKKFNELEPGDFRDIDVALFADVPELSDAALRGLEERVHGGLGLCVFVGPGVLPEFYNAKLIHPLERTAGLLPAELDRVQEVPLSQGGLAPLEDIAWRHPLLAGLFDPSLGDLAQVQVGSYYRFAGALAKTDAVLASVAGVPAIIEHSVGAGKVLLFNTTANDAWSDLARRKSFVPLVDRVLNHLSGGVRQRTFRAGDTMTLASASVQPGETVSVLTPRGGTLTPTVSAAGNRTMLRLPPLAEPGVYRIQRSGENSPESAFVVQVGRGDSQLAPVEADLLRSWWQRADLDIMRADDAAERLSAGASQVSLVVGLLALAGLVFASEMFLVHWLCPRVNPQLSSPVIRRRVPQAAGTHPVS